MFSEYKKSYFQSDVAKLNSEIATLRPRLESAESALEDASSKSRPLSSPNAKNGCADCCVSARRRSYEALEKTGGVFPNRAHVAPDSSSLMMDVSSAFRGSESEYRGFGGGDDVGNISLRVRVKIPKASSSISGGVGGSLRCASHLRECHRPRSKRTRILKFHGRITIQCRWLKSERWKKKFDVWSTKEVI